MKTNKLFKKSEIISETKECGITIIKTKNGVYKYSDCKELKEHRHKITDKVREKRNTTMIRLMNVLYNDKEALLRFWYCIKSNTIDINFELRIQQIDSKVKFGFGGVNRLDMQYIATILPKKYNLTY